MPTNPYFNNFQATNEQNLIEDLIVESIRMYAHEMYYMPRTGINKDTTLNEYEYNKYEIALSVEFYIKSSASFEGMGAFMGKFDAQVKDQITLVMSKRSFNDFIKPFTGADRPLEGDLVYVPMIDACFQVNYVETALPFYTLGKLQTYEINLELYESTGDLFATGLPYIDDKYNAKNDIANDPFDQSSIFEAKANTMLDFSETNPFTDGF
jgi:hypothetical protein